MKAEGIMLHALAPKPSEQIEGLPTGYDQYAEAITLISVTGLLTKAETRRLRSRLAKSIEIWVAGKRRDPQGGGE